MRISGIFQKVSFSEKNSDLETCIFCSFRAQKDSRFWNKKRSFHLHRNLYFRFSGPAATSLGVIKILMVWEKKWVIFGGFWMWGEDYLGQNTVIFSEKLEKLILCLYWAKKCVFCQYYIKYVSKYSNRGFLQNCF